jgi:hypothetical protein
MIPAFFSSARMILLECHEAPAMVTHHIQQYCIVEIRSEIKVKLKLGTKMSYLMGFIFTSTITLFYEEIKAKLKE